MTSGTTVVSVVRSDTLPWSVAAVDCRRGRCRPSRVHARRRSAAHRTSCPTPAYLPRAEPRTFTGVGGREIHAFVYPPTNPDAVAPEGELPPFIVHVHGGPTSHSVPGVNLERAYFTSRGIGIIDVNYGGSSGYGRAYRNRLRGQWGVVDVEDAVAAAEALAEAGEADGARLGIRGGSAGGWTTVAALVQTDSFAAGAAYYPVTDLLPFAEDTHDFESRYLDGLIGPLPEARELYVERSPSPTCTSCGRRSCCCRATTTRWCHRRSRRPWPTPWPAPASRTPTCSSPVSSTGSGWRSRTSRRWSPSCRSTARSSASRRPDVPAPAPRALTAGHEISANSSDRPHRWMTTSYSASPCVMSRL